MNPVKLYTFGAPRAGLWRFAKRFTTKVGTSNIHRVYHATDPVPMIPIYPFLHAPLPGLGHYLASSESIVSAAAHDMGMYIKSVGESSWESLQGLAPPYSVETVVENWLKSKIPVNPANPKTWDWINAALIYVLKKIGIGGIAVLQGGLMGTFTLADKIAWLLQKGCSVLKQGNLVLQLMTKIQE